jgi:hypothetical protein
MSIYASEKSLSYVYICTNKHTKQFYIGYREGNVKKNLPSHIDFPQYKTSSTTVKNNFSNYDWIILAEFFYPNDAYLFEQELIRENWDNPLILNKNISGKIRRNNKNRVAVRKPDGNIIQCSTFDPKYLSGEYVFYAKGIKRTNEFKEKQSIANSGKVNMRTELGTIIRVELNDPRILTGELTHMNSGSKRTKETRQKQSDANKKPKPKTVCRIFDKKEMAMANYTQWLNCSNKGKKVPKIRCCRISDRKEMAVGHFTRQDKLV